MIIQMHTLSSQVFFCRISHVNVHHFHLFLLNISIVIKITLQQSSESLQSILTHKKNQETYLQCKIMHFFTFYLINEIQLSYNACSCNKTYTVSVRVVSSIQYLQVLLGSAIFRCFSQCVLCVTMPVCGFFLNGYLHSEGTCCNNVPFYCDYVSNMLLQNAGTHPENYRLSLTQKLVLQSGWYHHLLHCN